MPVLVDAAMLWLAMGAVVLTAGRGVGAGAVVGLVAYAIITLLLLGYAGLYRSRLTWRYLDDLRRIVAATAVGAMGVNFAQVILSADPAPGGSAALRTWFFAAVFLGDRGPGRPLLQGRALLLAPAGEGRAAAVGEEHAHHDLALEQ